MKLRTKILSVGMVTMLLGMAMLGALLVASQSNTYYMAVVKGSQGFARSLALEMVGSVASGRIGSLDHIVSQLADTHLGLLDIQSIAVLDHEQHVLAHSDTTRYGETLSDPFVLEAAKTDQPLMEESSIEGNQHLRISQPIITAIPGHKGLRWGTLLLEVNLGRFQADLLNQMWRSLIIVLLAIILFALLAYSVLTRGLIRPLNSIVKAAQEYAAGNLSVRAAVSSRDELGLLGNTVNDMAGRLQRYTGDLEDRIKERTTELQKTNQELSTTLVKLRDANDALSTLAITDGLTGLYNFRYFHQKLETEILRSRRLRNPLSLVMIDVDTFKLYNDRNGHPAGDVILQELAAIIRRRIRATDIACRYGGEEFVVLLLDTGKDFAAAVAEQLRYRVEEYDFPDRERQPSGRLTISLGIATFPDDAKEAAILLKASDDALYQAKEHGRNRVEVWHKPAPDSDEV